MQWLFVSGNKQIWKYMFYSTSFIVFVGLSPSHKVYVTNDYID